MLDTETGRKSVNIHRISVIRERNLLLKSSRMQIECTVCQQIAADLERLERIHAEKLELVRASISRSHTRDFHRLRAAEGKARGDLDFAMAELNFHIFSHHHKKAGKSEAQARTANHRVFI